MVQRSAHRIFLGATPRPHVTVGALGGSTPGRCWLRFRFAMSWPMVALRSAELLSAMTLARCSRMRSIVAAEGAAGSSSMPTAILSPRPVSASNSTPLPEEHRRYRTCRPTVRRRLLGVELVEDAPVALGA
jgi:hypothetical protein